MSPEITSRLWGEILNERRRLGRTPTPAEAAAVSSRVFEDVKPMLLDQFSAATGCGFICRDCVRPVAQPDDAVAGAPPCGGCGKIRARSA